MCSIGWSNFALGRHKLGEGLSFFTLTHDEVVKRVKDQWEHRQPGLGETGLDRKVVVPIDPTGFFTSVVALRDDLPLQAQVTRRQEGEDLYVEIFVETSDAEKLGITPEPAKFCSIVCYSVEALLENKGTRTTDDEWEIVAVLASNVETEPMPPLTMARNFLEKTGGTKSVYTALEFAEAIYANSLKDVKIKTSTKTPKQVATEMGFLSNKLHNLKASCKHNFPPLTAEQLADEWMSESAYCTICNTAFGWRCKDSPDSVCHYTDDIDTENNQVFLINGQFGKLPDGFDLENHYSESCIYCGSPEERK